MERSARLSSFITDVLQRDLSVYEAQLSRINGEIEEMNQLSNSVQNIQKHFAEEGFKTKMNIGANMFMQAKVADCSHIYLHLGKNVYVEFGLDEALKYIDLKIRILTKESGLVREESIKTRAKIKLALICLSDETKGSIK